MIRVTLALIAAVGLISTGAGCKKGCDKVAEVAQKCVDKAKDESVEELAGECKTALEKKRPWAQASIDCAEETTECDAWNKCVEEKAKAAK